MMAWLDLEPSLSWNSGIFAYFFEHAQQKLKTPALANDCFEMLKINLK